MRGTAQAGQPAYSYGPNSKLPVRRRFRPACHSPLLQAAATFICSANTHSSAVSEATASCYIADKRCPGPDVWLLGQRRRPLPRGRRCCLCTAPSTRRGAGASTSCRTLPRAAGTRWRSACAGRRAPDLRMNRSQQRLSRRLTCGIVPARAHNAVLFGEGVGRAGMSSCREAIQTHLSRKICRAAGRHCVTLGSPLVA